MDWQYTPYTLPLLLSTAICLIVAVYAWRYRTTPGVKPFIVLILATAEWSLTYVLELAYPDLPSKILWTQIQYVGIVFVPTMWLSLPFNIQISKNGCRPGISFYSLLSLL